MTDVLDGKLARSRNSVTELGKFLDPVADKAMIATAMISLSILDRMPWWITIVILSRELFITIFRLAVIKRGVIPANRGEKLSSRDLVSASMSCQYRLRFIGSVMALCILLSR
jgi:CDP-diacylglycerol--glycerol-3-phosphate 3-phosphatidyltransferase